MRKKERQEKSLEAFVSGAELPDDIVHPDFGKEEMKAKKNLSTITISPRDIRDYAAYDVVHPRTVTWENAYRTFVDTTVDDSYITTSRWYSPSTDTFSF